MTSLVHVISSSSTDAKLGKDLEEAAAILSQLWSNLKVEKEKALVSKATNWMKMYTMPGHVTRCYFHLTQRSQNTYQLNDTYYIHNKSDPTFFPLTIFYQVILNDNYSFIES